ncbi:LuxR C-terminal-related transcriptional regulator [Maricaulis sp.]|uniref:response regulator transcription factor n=1 Tax=Maricaulis sp. TaxID=1486257 RepID=UPI0026286281|nr:LuxR C-terminal-related transcriptional regulator [Maricaulis sp.]
MAANTELKPEEYVQGQPVVEQPPVPMDETVELALLSPRELEITRCVAKGFSNKETARLLGISHWTVAAHLKASFLKLGVKRRSELAFLMRRIL